MSKFKIDFVATPFAGHLHPLLELANGLRNILAVDVRILSTGAAARSVEMQRLPLIRLLEGKDEIISGIANAPKQVGSNPFRLLGQLRDNLSMMDQLVSELSEHWTVQRPDLVIVDFAVPVAGLLAKSLSIPWWTSLTSVSAMETVDGTPTYLGGWKPMPGRAGQLRDYFGRSLIRTFKQSVHMLFRKRMQRLGIHRIYRQDRLETIYSDEKILALSPEEFEFSKTWPTQLSFVGPLTSSPDFPHEEPSFVEGKPHVLVSLGTHIRWAKNSATALVQSLAKKMPDVEFHFTKGEVLADSSVKLFNYREYSYFPYDKYMHRYQASINHVGTGVLFSCLKAGIPILAWPHDFDQFDHAARLDHLGLGIRCRPTIDPMQSDLRRLLTDQKIKDNVVRFQKTLSGYAPSTGSQI